MLALPFVHQSAFAADITSGNPATVILPPPEVDAKITDVARAAISANFAQPMTAWVVPSVVQDEDAQALPSHARAFRIRYFTATLEVPLCGHATLCAPGALFADTARVPPDVTELHFFAETKKIVARRAGGAVEIALPAGQLADFALDDAREDKLREVVRRAVGEGVEIVYVGAGQGHLSFYALIEIDVADLGALQVDASAFNDSPFEVNVVTSRSADSTLAFVSRMFAARAGVPEDPVCGTAHTLLGPYWATKAGLDARLDGEGLVARQVSARGGEVRIARDSAGWIRLTGRAVTLARGEVYV